MDDAATTSVRRALPAVHSPPPSGLAALRRSRRRLTFCRSRSAYASGFVRLKRRSRHEALPHETRCWPVRGSPHSSQVVRFGARVVPVSPLPSRAPSRGSPGSRRELAPVAPRDHRRSVSHHATCSSACSSRSPSAVSVGSRGPPPDGARAISESIAEDLAVIDFVSRKFGVLSPREEYDGGGQWHLTPLKLSSPQRSLHVLRGPSLDIDRERVLSELPALSQVRTYVRRDRPRITPASPSALRSTGRQRGDGSFAV